MPYCIYMWCLFVLCILIWSTAYCPYSERKGQVDKENIENKHSVLGRALQCLVTSLECAGSWKTKVFKPFKTAGCWPDINDVHLRVSEPRIITFGIAKEMSETKTGKKGRYWKLLVIMQTTSPILHTGGQKPTEHHWGVAWYSPRYSNTAEH